MIKKRWIVFFLFLAASFGCRLRNVSLEPLTPGRYFHFNMRFHFTGTNGKGSGKIILKMQSETTLFYLFDPINRLKGFAYCLGENVTLVNAKRHLYWKGAFVDWIRHSWDFSISLAEFKDLICEGRIPKNEEPAQSFEIKIKKQSQVPRSFSFRKGEKRVTLTIFKRKIVSGTLKISENPSGMQPASLDEIFVE